MDPNWGFLGIPHCSRECPAEGNNPLPPCSDRSTCPVRARPETRGGLFDGQEVWARHWLWRAAQSRTGVSLRPPQSRQSPRLSLRCGSSRLSRDPPNGYRTLFPNRGRASEKRPSAEAKAFPGEVPPAPARTVKRPDSRPSSTHVGNSPPSMNVHEIAPAIGRKTDVLAFAGAARALANTAPQSTRRKPLLRNRPPEEHADLAGLRPTAAGGVGFGDDGPKRSPGPGPTPFSISDPLPGTVTRGRNLTIQEGGKLERTAALSWEIRQGYPCNRDIASMNRQNAYAERTIRYGSTYMRWLVWPQKTAHPSANARISI
jgi:hypothetical protein